MADRTVILTRQNQGEVYNTRLDLSKENGGIC